MKDKKQEIFAVTERKFEYKGRECIVVFTRLGFRNGYVSVKKRIDCNKLNYIDVHGGLTCCDKIYDYYGPTREYYVGFNCDHRWGDRGCDGTDMNQAVAYGLETIDNKDKWLNFDGPVRTVEYVSEECKKVVDQLEGNKYGI